MSICLTQLLVEADENPLQFYIPVCQEVILPKQIPPFPHQQQLRSPFNFCDTVLVLEKLASPLTLFLCGLASIQMLMSFAVLPTDFPLLTDLTYSVSTPTNLGHHQSSSLESHKIHIPPRLRMSFN